MTTINYLDLIDPTIASFLEEDQTDKAIDIANKVLAAAKEDWGDNAFYHAKEVSTAYFQLMLVYGFLGKDREAAEAAKQAFLYDRLLIDQYLPIFTTLLKVSDPEMDKCAAEVYGFFDENLHTIHAECEEVETMAEMLTECQDRSKDIYWELKYRHLLNFAKNSPLIFFLADGVLKEIKQLESEGFDPIKCDAIRCLVYYRADKEDKAVEIWGNRPLSDAPNIYFLVYIALSMMTQGIKLPEKIEFPEDKDVIRISSAWNVVYGRIRLLLANGLTDELKAKLEQDEEVKTFFYQCISLSQQIAKYGVSIYNDFLNGAVNGYATSSFKYADFLNNLGNFLDQTGNWSTGLEILKQAMESYPHERFATSILRMALHTGNSELALSSLRWLQENLEEKKSSNFTHIHFLDRSERWAHGLCCNSFEEYEKYIDAYDEKHKELNRIMRSFISNMEVHVPKQFSKEYQEYIEANKNNRTMLSHFLKREPKNKKLIASLLKSYATDPVLPIEPFLKEHEHLIDILREDLSTDEDKRYFCEGLAAFGFLMTIPKNQTNKDESEIPSSTTDNAEIEKGLTLIEEAMKYVQDKRQCERLLVYKINILLYLNRWEECKACCEKGLELLEGEQPNAFPEVCFPRAWRFHRYELKDFPSILFFFYSYLITKCAEKLHDPYEDLIRYLKRAFSYSNNPYLLHYLSHLLFLFAIEEGEESKAYNECLQATFDCLDGFFKENKDHDIREELLKTMMHLALPKKHLRFAFEILDNLKNDYASDEYIGDLNMLYNSAYDELYKAKKQSSKAHSARIKEAKERRSRTNKRLKRNGLSAAPRNFPYIETSDMVHMHSVQEVIRRIVIISYIAKIVKYALNEDELFSQYPKLNQSSDKNIEEMKTLGLYDDLSNYEDCIIEGAADFSLIYSLKHIDAFSLPLLWALGEIDGENIYDFFESDCSNMANKYKRDNTLLLEGKLRSTEEILDLIDYLFVLKYKGMERIEEEDYDEEEFYELEEKHNYLLAWLEGLNWLVNYNGLNKWSYEAIGSRQPFKGLF